MTLHTVGYLTKFVPVAPFTWWPAEAAKAYGANPATIESRNGHGVVAFDDSTEQAAFFNGVAPQALGTNGLVLTLDVMAATGVIGAAVFSVALERVQVATTDLDVDSFGPAWTTEVAVDGVSGVPTRTQVSFALSETGGLAAGEPFRVLIRRKVSDARDDLVGKAQVLRVFVEESGTLLVSKTAATILAALLLSWHAADDPSSITLSGFDVSLFADKTANGYDLSGTSNLPKYDTADPFGVGLNAIYFNEGGVGDQERLECQIGSPLNGGFPFYAWCSFIGQSGGGNHALWNSVDGLSGSTLFQCLLQGNQFGDPLFLSAYNGGHGGAQTSSGYAPGAAHVAKAFVQDATYREVWIDAGNSGTSTSSKTPNAGTVFSMGVQRYAGGFASFLQGWVGELAFVNATGITPQQISDMDVLTAFKWGAPAP